jgi:hypothetical protein
MVVNAQRKTRWMASWALAKGERWRGRGSAGGASLAMALLAEGRGHGEVGGVRDGQQDLLDPEKPRAILGLAVQVDDGDAVAVGEDLHVSPVNALAPSGAEDLQHGLLGGKAPGDVDVGIRCALEQPQLVAREDLLLEGPSTLGEKRPDSLNFERGKLVGCSSPMRLPKTSSRA